MEDGEEKEVVDLLSDPRSPQAMTVLVAHLVGQSDLSDLATGFKLDGVEFQRIFKEGEATGRPCKQVLILPIGNNTNPRMKAFSPLVPQGWTSTTLTFVKEMDLMASRRTEASGASSSTRSQNQEEAAAPKKRLRYPKKPKEGADK